MFSRQITDLKKVLPFLAVLTLSLLVGEGLAAILFAADGDGKAVKTDAVVKADKRDAPNPAALAKGKKVYETNCMVCHGPKGGGDGAAASGLNPKPRNFLKDAFKQGESEGEIFNTVSKGLAGTAMPAWEAVLSEKDRKNVAAFVHSLRPKKDKDTPKAKEVAAATTSKETKNKPEGGAK